MQALKQSGSTVRLRVTHEPQPVGLKEVVLRRNAGEPLGLNICGGINSPPANPLDKTDEGIFIEKVFFAFSWSYLSTYYVYWILSEIPVTSSFS